MGKTKDFFKSQFKVIRKARELSQEQLAVIIDVDQATIQRWEKGNTRPSYEQLDKLSDIFGVPPSFFFPGGEMKVVEPTPEQALEVLAKAIRQPQIQPKEDLPSSPSELRRLIPALNDYKAKAVLTFLNGLFGKGALDDSGIEDVQKHRKA